ncbi:CD5 antigen-like [Thunnus thynnus]|uniref:CD5 antigen-like n=1 Tax=Thunnus thynnus TaxID=8237 RepID=UPI00352954F4
MDILYEFFQPDKGMHSDSQKILILITDEESRDDVSLDSHHLRDDGIEIYTIGVKNVNETQLRTIASDPDEIHMFSVIDSSFLLDIVANLTINLCNRVNSLDSVRLVNGTSLCSGRLEVKSEQSWSSVCEADFDQQDAEVVCRELGCGAPSVLQGALYGEVEAPMWTKEFQCGGHESALLDCGRSDSARSTCSPGKAVGLTCSEPVRLVGGASRCAGTLEVKWGEWRPVSDSYWTLKEAAAACRVLDCGSAVSTGRRNEVSDRSVWWISSDCVQSGSALRDCASSDSSSSIVELTCSDSVRLVNGTSLCSGRLEVKSEQSWSSVCEADFDQQDAEVVCRELGCGAPSVLQGALYGEVEAPMWTKEFQCGGHESALLDCGRSDSARSTCSPGKAVGLTCSEPVRLVGGASRCAGTLEVKQGEWRPVEDFHWTLKEAAAACRDLDCGSAVSTGSRNESSDRSVWCISSDCVHSGSALRECASSSFSPSIVELTCSAQTHLHPRTPPQPCSCTPHRLMWSEYGLNNSVSSRSRHAGCHTEQRGGLQAQYSRFERAV